MEKEPYETYQFMETDNPEPEINQLLVLQEDGTLLSVNRDIQYITQVQDVKEVIGDTSTCAVFDVSSQHFYVDVDNTSDLIVPEQFVIPPGDGTIYSNSFLIQPETSTTPELMETETIAPVSKLEPQNEQEITNSVAENNFTEITLTHAQYHLLEQKGWILLEINERIFVLDTLGLRDITADEKLIQKLKDELESSTIQPIDPGPGPAEIEINPNSAPNLNNEELDVSAPHEEISDIKSEIELKCEQITTEISENTTNEYPKVPIESQNVQQDEHNDLNILSSVVAIQNIDDGNQKCDSIKIKTKYTFSDIPDKIFLGKTVNGKKLYAKITNKIKNNTVPVEEIPKAEMLGEPQFISLIQDYIREHPSNIKINDVIAADTVVTQLMRMTRIKETVMGNYVIITKSVTSISDNGQEKIRRKPTVIVGEVKHLEGTQNKFIHTPYLLHNLAKTRISSEPVDLMAEYVDFIHIHITETKMVGKPSTQSINVCNRKLSLEVLCDTRKKYPTPVHACGACAAVFRSEDALKIHLENHCSGTMSDDVLTIDMDQLHGSTDSYYTIDIGDEKWYTCMQCEERFSKLSNCKRHTTTHAKPMKRNQEDEEVSDSEAQEYRCQMCPSKYFHASSLTKHIVKRHIQVQANK